MVDKVPKSRLIYYRNAFDMFDKKKIGVLTYKEISNVLSSLNLAHSEEEIKEMIDEVDLDGNGEIDFDEFVTLMDRKSQQIDIEEELINAFRVLEKEGNGLISLTDLRNLMINRKNEEEIDEILSENDKDEDGYINYEEFIKFILKK